MEQQFMLTTFDNPFNPFVDFSSWYMFDCEKGHNTSSRIARLVNIDSEMTQKEIDEERERVMNFIVQYDLEDLFFKGTEEQIDKWIKSQRGSRSFENYNPQHKKNNSKAKDDNETSEKNEKSSEENNETQTATTTNA